MNSWLDNLSDIRAKEWIGFVTAFVVFSYLAVTSFNGLFQETVTFASRYSNVDRTYTGWPKQLLCGAGLAWSLSMLNFFFFGVLQLITDSTKLQVLQSYNLVIMLVVMAISCCAAFIATIAN